MFDKGVVPYDEFAKKLINQGMILGTSAFMYKLICGHGADNSERVLDFINETKDLIFVSESYIKGYNVEKNIESLSKNELISEIDIHVLTIPEFLKSNFPGNDSIIEDLKFGFQKMHVDVNLVNSSDELDVNKFLSHQLYKEYNNAKFILEEGVYKVGRDVEKMSKSKYNVVNPDEICEQYGADSLRLYEMFLGPLEQYKPWNTAGITGVSGFLRKLWKLYFDDTGLKVNDAEPSKDSLKTLHKTIKKVEEDIDNFSFNTSVSTFMIAVNELTTQKCTSKEILETLLVVISPYAPHIAEELWNALGNNESISTAPFPVYDEKHLVESSKNYPISFNGKMRFTMELPLDMSKEDIEKAVLENEKTKEHLQGREPKKVIVVPGKIVNIVG